VFEENAMTQSPARPQLAHLTAALDELRAKGTYFKLRILDDQQELPRAGQRPAAD
jgi:hypothetical protein